MAEIFAVKVSSGVHPVHWTGQLDRLVGQDNWAGLDRFVGQVYGWGRYMRNSSELMQWANSPAAWSTDTTL